MLTSSHRYRRLPQEYFRANLANFQSNLTQSMHSLSRVWKISGPLRSCFVDSRQLLAEIGRFRAKHMLKLWLSGSFVRTHGSRLVDSGPTLADSGLKCCSFQGFICQTWEEFGVRSVEFGQIWAQGGRCGRVCTFGWARNWPAFGKQRLVRPSFRNADWATYQKLPSRYSTKGTGGPPDNWPPS